MTEVFHSPDLGAVGFRRRHPGHRRAVRADRRDAGRPRRQHPVRADRDAGRRRGPRHLPRQRPGRRRDPGREPLGGRHRGTSAGPSRASARWRRSWPSGGPGAPGSCGRPRPGRRRVTVDNSLSDTHTVVEVKAPDRLGLLYLVTRALAAEGSRHRHREDRHRSGPRARRLLRDGPRRPEGRGAGGARAPARGHRGGARARRPCPVLGRYRGEVARVAEPVARAMVGLRLRPEPALLPRARRLGDRRRRLRRGPAPGRGRSAWPSPERSTSSTARWPGRPGQVSPFGAFLDSVLDRYSDLLVLAGLVFLFARARPPGGGGRRAPAP